MNVVIVQSSSNLVLGQLAEAAATSARGSGHNVTILDLVADGFTPWMSAADRSAYHGEHPLVDPLIAEYASHVSSAGALVFLDHAQMSGLSPYIKGWLDRVLVPGVAFVLDERTHRVKRGLTAVRWVIGINVSADKGSSGRRTVTRAVRLCTGWRTRVKWFELAPDGDLVRLTGQVSRRLAHL